MAEMLSFEQAPPLSVPLRFFATAPLFGVAAGFLLAWLGATGVHSRWAPGTLALVHLLTVGYMLQAMCGALLQFVPVAVGTNVRRPRALAALSHLALAAAAILLAAGFATGEDAPLMTAAGLFVVALGAYISIVGAALLNAARGSATITSLRAALASLLITLVLGATQVAAFTGKASIGLGELVPAHIAWGLGGWAFLLLFGVSLNVVPMFQLTPPYPTALVRFLPRTMVALLIGFTLAVWLGASDVVGEALIGAGMLLCAGYAATTLLLQQRRRRRVTDPTFWFFRGAMIAMLALAAVWLLGFAHPAWLGDARWAMLLGVLAIVGVFVSAINGMIYKIVPFMIWLHLQRECPRGVLPPNMRLIIAEASMRRQMFVHFFALALLCAALFAPGLMRASGLALAASNVWLAANVAVGLRKYLSLKARIRADAALRES